MNSVGVTDATGYVAVDNQNKLIVLSYRGSVSVSNWIGNIDVVFNDFALCSGCQVHAGFLSSWNDSKEQVIAALSQAKTLHPDYTIIFTGHSLGGAISTLAAAELRQQGFSAALVGMLVRHLTSELTIGKYTFGSPMVGNDAFANFVTNQSGGNYRITHAYDIVPKLPGYMLDYRHVSPEYWITSDSGVTVGSGDISVSNGIFDLWGNQGTLISTITDHLWYFNAISSCII